MENIITIKNISKFYRVGNERVKALNNINLAIGKGEICCILGTSGSGKSTLLNQLAGLEKPTAGSVYIGRTNISRLSENQLAGFRQRSIGFVFQSYNLIPSMTAIENVAMPLLFRGVGKSTREREALQMLKKVGLGNRAKHKPSEMSGGQQQRVGIARAFVAKPKIVFADEPTGNLDSRTTLEVMRLLIDMSHDNGITFVLVTHDNELAKYADRIITIKDGLVVGDEKNEHPAYMREEAIGEAVTKSLPAAEAPVPKAEQQNGENEAEAVKEMPQGEVITKKSDESAKSSTDEGEKPPQTALTVTKKAELAANAKKQGEKESALTEFLTKLFSPLRQWKEKVEEHIKKLKAKAGKNK